MDVWDGVLQELKRKRLPSFVCGFNFNFELLKQYKYLFKLPLFLRVLSFGRAKGEEDPLSL